MHEKKIDLYPEQLRTFKEMSNTDMYVYISVVEWINNS